MLDTVGLASSFLYQHQDPKRCRSCLSDVRYECATWDPMSHDFLSLYINLSLLVSQRALVDCDLPCSVVDVGIVVGTNLVSI